MNEAAVKIQTVIRCFLAKKRVERRLKRHVQRTKIAYELAETETRYLADLKALRHDYIGSLLQLKLIDMQTALGTFCLEPLDAIIDATEQLEKRLRDVVDNWSYSAVIGNSFTCDSAFLPLLSKVYGDYVIAFDAQQAALAKLLEREKPIRKHIDATRMNPEAAVHGLDLSSMMILAVQRVPRYGLLVRELVKYTEEDSDDFEPLVEAQKALAAVGDEINERKKKADTEDVLDRLATQIDDVDKTLERIDKAKRKAHKHDGQDIDDRMHLRDGKLRVYVHQDLPKFTVPKQKKNKHKKKKNKKKKGKSKKGKGKKGKGKGKKKKKKHERGRGDIECSARLVNLVPAHQSAPADIVMRDAKEEFVVLFSDSMLFAPKLGSSLSSLCTRITTGYRFSSPKYLHYESAHVMGASVHPCDSLMALEMVRTDGIVTHTIIFDSASERQLWLSDLDQPTTRDIDNVFASSDSSRSESDSSSSDSDSSSSDSDSSSSDSDSSSSDSD